MAAGTDKNRPRALTGRRVNELRATIRRGTRQSVQVINGKTGRARERSERRSNDLAGGVKDKIRRSEGHAVFEKREAVTWKGLMFLFVANDVGGERLYVFVGDTGGGRRDDCLLGRPVTPFLPGPVSRGRMAAGVAPDLEATGPHAPFSSAQNGGIPEASDQKVNAEDQTERQDDDGDILTHRYILSASVARCL
jgi:hypothetical protein